MSDYFTELGKATAAFLSSHPAAREHIRGIADNALTSHLSRPMAKDSAMPMPSAMRPRGDQDPGDPGETITAEQAQQELQSIFDRLDPAERGNMLQVLVQFCEEHAAEADGMDRGFRRPAMDAALMRRRNAASFRRRWGDLVGGVEIWSGTENWRR